MNLAMSSSRPKASESHRITKACARCRRRKIRCDLGFPICGACSLAKSECLGYDAVKGKERPRSDISHLESQVAQLEIKLATVKAQQKTTAFDSASRALEIIALPVAQATALPQGISCTKDGDAILALMSPIFLSEAPRPSFQNDVVDSRIPRESLRDAVDAITISSIPRQVVDILLKNYMHTYMAQYPFLEEAELLESCEKTYRQDPQISHFEKFSIAMALGISANTLVRHDEKRATQASAGFWSAALKQLPHVGQGDPWQRLQTLLLLAHYSFLDPNVINTSTCTSAATRLCLHLGLHRELSFLDQKRLGPAAVKTRRRLFWATYSLDAAVRSILCQPFIWPESSITALYPDFGVSASAITHNWSLRRMEAEVTSTLFFPHLSAITDSSFPTWFANMHERLYSWREQTRSQNVLDGKLAEKIEFYELLYQYQIFRLNRLSPRCPDPSLEMRKKAQDAAILMLEEYSRNQRLGKLFYVWQAAHQLLELGVSILESVLYGLEISSTTQPTHLDSLDPTILIKTIRTVPTLLQFAAKRWPAIHPQAVAFEAIAIPVISQLQTTTTGRPARPDPRIRQRLIQYLLPLRSLPDDETTRPGTNPHSASLDLLATASQQHRSLFSSASAFPAPSEPHIDIDNTAPPPALGFDLDHVHPGIQLRDFLGLGSQAGARYPRPELDPARTVVASSSPRQQVQHVEEFTPGVSALDFMHARARQCSVGRTPAAAVQMAEGSPWSEDGMWDLAGLDLEDMFSALLAASQGPGDWL